MMTAPFFSELPPDMADDSVWRASHGGGHRSRPGPADGEDFQSQVLAAQPMLTRIAQRLLRNPAWAEDAVSETLVAALERPGKFAGRSQLRTWLVGILKNKTTDQIRCHTREAQWMSAGEVHAADEAESAAPGAMQEPPSPWGNPSAGLQQRQFLSRLDHCLQALPPKQARAFVMVYAEDEQTRDVCSALGVTASILGVLLHRARAQLRVGMAR